MKDAITEVEAKGIDYSPWIGRADLQSKLYNAILASHCIDIKPVLLRRLRRFDSSAESAHFAPNVIAKYKQLLRTYKSNLVANHLRSWCNQWCTASRFGDRDRMCAYGCHTDKDMIEHCLSCGRFQNLFHSYFGYNGPVFSSLDVIAPVSHNAELCCSIDISLSTTT